MKTFLVWFPDYCNYLNINCISFREIIVSISVSITYRFSGVIPVVDRILNIDIHIYRWSLGPRGICRLIGGEWWQKYKISERQAVSSEAYCHCRQEFSPLSRSTFKSLFLLCSLILTLNADFDFLRFHIIFNIKYWFLSFLMIFLLFTGILFSDF